MNHNKHNDDVCRHPRPRRRPFGNTARIRNEPAYLTRGNLIFRAVGLCNARRERHQFEISTCQQLRPAWSRRNFNSELKQRLSSLCRISISLSQVWTTVNSLSLSSSLALVLSQVRNRLWGRCTSPATSSSPSGSWCRVAYFIRHHLRDWPT